TDPLVVKIPGLVINPGLGSLAPLHISVNNIVHSLGELQGLPAAIANSIPGLGNYTGFDNLSPGAILQAFNGLIGQLSSFGGFGAFAQTLPLLGHKLGEIADLGSAFTQVIGIPSLPQVPTAQDLFNFLKQKLPGASVVPEAGDLLVTLN